MATDAEVAAHLDLTDRSVRDLKRRGVLEAAGRGGLNMDACRVAYIRHLRGQAAGRMGSKPGALSLPDERARLAKEQADRMALQNAALRGTLLRADVVENIIGLVVDNARTRLLAIPTTAAPQLVGARSTEAIKSTLTDLLYDALQELSDAALRAKVTDAVAGVEDIEDEQGADLLN